MGPHGSPIHGSPRSTWDVLTMTRDLEVQSEWFVHGQWNSMGYTEMWYGVYICIYIYLNHDMVFIYVYIYISTIVFINGIIWYYMVLIHCQWESILIYDPMIHCRQRDVQQEVMPILWLDMLRWSMEVIRGNYFGSFIVKSLEKPNNIAKQIFQLFRVFFRCFFFHIFVSHIFRFVQHFCPHFCPAPWTDEFQRPGRDLVLRHDLSLAPGTPARSDQRVHGSARAHWKIPRLLLAGRSGGDSEGALGWPGMPCFFLGRRGKNWVKLGGE